MLGMGVKITHLEWSFRTGLGVTRLCALEPLRPGIAQEGFTPVANKLKWQGERS
jgi:hypothetical protein